MNNYTTGGWTVAEESYTGDWFIKSNKGEYVALVNKNHAHLISAAMDMYEALKQVEVDYETLCNRKPKNTLLQARLRMLKQALAKAVNNG